MIRRPVNGRLRLQAGLTIVEIVVTIVVIGLALVAISALVGFGVSESADTMTETRAVALGYSYLEEILGRRYDERTPRSGSPPCYGLSGGGRCTAEASFGPDGSESRETFDDVDDFHGLVEGAGEATPLEDAEGNTRTGYDNFRVEVTVRYGGDDAVLGLTETDAKFITVNVRNTSLGLNWDFSAYRGNF